MKRPRPQAGHARRGCALRAGFLLVVLLVANGCSLRAGTEANSPPLTPTRRATGSPVSTSAPSPTASPAPPTATPLPLAARVNGWAISLATYEAHRARLFDAQAQAGMELAPQEVARRALDDLIDQALLAQGAAEAGFMVDEAMLAQRITELTAAAGGPERFQAWLVANHYTPESFEEDLRLSLAAAWMRDQIIAGVPEVAEQVHARQVLLYNRDDADEVLAQLNSGADFSRLAAVYDPLGLGDLGWFPRGYLIEKEIEAVAFELSPGEISPVIETRLGFHILQVIERQMERPLDADARMALQEQALQNWLLNRRNESDIEVLVALEP